MSDREHNGMFKRFPCSNPFRTVKFFVFCQGFLQLTQLMTSGYMKSTISTIEKRFGFSSQTSGLVASFNEVGNTMLIIFVSYFGSRVHRPRFIGYGAILVALSGFITSLPHFITGPYEYDRSVAGNQTDMCLPDEKETSSATEVCTESMEQEGQVVLALLLFGQTLLGIGGVPIQPFGISYIDDFASKNNSPLYIGILFATSTIGPAIAFIVGSIMLRFYVDIDKVPASEININKDDPRWIGAWWLGFVSAASVVAISSIPYFFFPRELPKEEEAPRKKSIVEMNKADLKDELKNKPKDMDDFTLSQFIKMFPVVLMRNIKNPIFVTVIFALINLSGMIAGLATFLAKFLERQFTLSASVANMIIGAVNVPGALLGIILGGVIMKNCQLSLRQATIMCMLGMGFCILFDLPLLFMGCPSPTVAGLDTGSSGDQQLVADCNKRCDCSPSAFNPVCGQDNIEYISPCYAGCSGLIYNSKTKKVENYTMCNCIVVNGALGNAAPGQCPARCSHFLLPFVMIACISGFMASLSHTPAFVIILRNVRPEDKSFAVGIQFLLLRVLAWLPAPVLYGSAIDTSCRLWQQKCNKKAACRYYDNTLFRYRFVGIQILYESCCFVAFCVLYFLLVRQEKQEQEDRSRASSPQPTAESRA